MNTKKTKALSNTEKTQIAEVFGYLLSDLFGGDKYKKYFFADMKTLATSTAVAEMSRRRYKSPVTGVILDAVQDMTRTTTAESLLSVITEMALIEEGLAV